MITHQSSPANRPVNWKRWQHTVNAAITHNDSDFLLSDRQRSRRYPTRLLRYLIPFHWIGQEAERRGRPLRICEIGIAHGLMLKYMLLGLEHVGVAKARVIDHWLGVDVKLMPEYLSKLPYDGLIEGDVEAGVDGIDLECDICVLLHVLEHLKRPELAIERILEKLPAGSLLIVGFPNHMNCMLSLRESYLRAHTNENGHVSALSAQRFAKVVRKLGCEIVDRRSAFFLRASGSILEDSQVWQRFNLGWGSLFQDWIGEFYAVVRKP